MSNAHTIDEARLGIMLNERRLPTKRRCGRNVPNRPIERMARRPVPLGHRRA
jgi:hypothetical protein